MILIVNPTAGGGVAVRKLRAIQSSLRKRWGEFVLESTWSPEGLKAVLTSGYAAGERQFVAAGGDGSVNALVHAIMTGLPESQRGSVAIGAIGIGSSNDFHKPFREDRMLAGIPCLMDFSSARPRDVAVLEFGRNGSTERRYFLINASAGLTAEANRFFNEPDPLLALLKRRSTGAAILYAAIRTMAIYRNRRLTIQRDDEGRTDATVTNLAILKSPHVSGGLRFPGEAAYDSGLLVFHLAGELHFGGRFRLFQALAKGRAPKGRTMRSWKSQGATISSDGPFALEFDGEVITTDNARFSVLPRHLQVCTC